MQKIVPYLWFDDQAEEAATFYTSIFSDSAMDSIARYQEDMPGPAGKVMTVTFTIAGYEFVALNGGPVFSFTPAISFFVDCQTRDQLDALWQNLSTGGMALMELDAYPFSERFGWVQDRYGISWQLSLSGRPQQISPYFLFVGEQHGRAEEAIRLYTSVFRNAKITHIERFGKDEGETGGTVKHARFVLEGQNFIAMDSGLEHPFTFTPAISLFVNCEDQAEVDFLWEKLLEDGSESQCGWLTDRFGVSWQIVPTILGELMSDPDPEKAYRVAQAMLKMVKLDVDALVRAYGGVD